MEHGCRVNIGFFHLRAGKVLMFHMGTSICKMLHESSLTILFIAFDDK